MLENSQFIRNFEYIRPDGRNFEMLTDISHVIHYKFNAYEKYTADLILSRCLNGGIFIDIGAHHGFYTLLIANQLKKCDVIAFEPVPENFKILNENLKHNNNLNVKTYDLAISDRDDVRDFKVAQYSSRGSFYDRPNSEILFTMKVRTVSLDSLVNNKEKKPVVIKVDTEGHEINVLKGMTDLLRDTEDITIVLEFNPSMLRQANRHPEEMLELIKSLGFDIYLIDDERSFTYKLNEKQLGAWESYFGEGNFHKDYFNILCIKKTRSLSVCFFSHASQLEGAERSLLEIVRKLSTESQILCTVVLPTHGPLKLMLEEAGVSTLVIEYTWWCDKPPFTEDQLNDRLTSSFTKISEQLSILKNINPDIVITNTLVIPWGALIAHILKKPHVWFIREFGESDHGLQFPQTIEYVLKIVKESSNLIIVNSNAVSSALFGPAVPEYVVTIYPDVYISPGSSDTNEKKYFSTSDAVKVVIFGTITESKGQLDAILAVNELIRRKYNVELVVMGKAEPSYLQRLKDIVHAENLESYIHFLDFLENPYPVVSQADIVLACSKREAFGRVVLEGMTLKKPVIGSNTGGIPEQIIEGYNGFLYEPGDYVCLADKIEYFIQNREKITEFGEHGYEYASNNFLKVKNSKKLAEFLHGLKGASHHSSEAISQFTEQTMISALSVLSSALYTQQAEHTTRDTKIQALEANNARLEAEIQWIQAEIQRMQSGIMMSMLKRYVRVLDKLAPRGTRRRGYYELGMAGARIFVNKGFGDLWSSYKRFRSANRMKLLQENSSKLALLIKNAHKAGKSHTILLFDHSLGGGANIYSQKVVAQKLYEGYMVLNIIYDHGQQKYILKSLFKDYSSVFSLLGLDDIEYLWENVPFGEVFLNNIASFPEPLKTVQMLCAHKQDSDYTLTVALHDFYPICPSFTLLDTKGRFCSLPPLEVCRECLPVNDYVFFRSADSYDIGVWRGTWKKTLEMTNKVLCFSESSSDLMTKIYPLSQGQLEVCPHDLPESFLKKPVIEIDSTLNIGVVGTISYHKGARILQDVAKILWKRQPEATITVIGTLEGKEHLDNVKVTGWFKSSDLPDLLEKYKINICFFPSIWPETFSYVCSELMELKMPLCCYDLGAQGERIRKYELGHVISQIDPDITVDEIIQFYMTLKNTMNMTEH
jgi:FkbM family methyltransferase